MVSRISSGECRPDKARGAAEEGASGESVCPLRDQSAEMRDEQDFAGVSCEELYGFVNLAEFHAVGDEPVEVQFSGVQQQQALFPGFPEPAAEDAPQCDALFVDVRRDVDFRRTAGVSNGDDGGFAADGFEEGGQCARCSGAFEGDIETAATAGQFAATFNDAVVGVQRGGAELFGLGAAVGVGVNGDDMGGAHEQCQVHHDEAPLR